MKSISPALAWIALTLGIASAACGAPPDATGELPDDAIGTDEGADEAYEDPRASSTPFERGAVDPVSGTILAADRAWSFVPLPDTRCANGTASGIGVNPASGAEDMVVYFQGGGACWNLATCGIGTAANLRKGYDEDDFARDDIREWAIFSRAEARNPFRGMTQVVVPYCTGDVHAGTREKTYGAGLAQVTMGHYGARNVDAILRHLKATYPGLRRLVVVGTSAGGFGAQLNFPRFVAAFPAARIDVVADSAQLINPQGGLTAEWVANWGIELPPACAGCGTDFPKYLDYLTATYPAARFGLLASMRDATLTPFFNFGINVQAFRDRTSELLTDRYEPRGNARYLARSGIRHGYLNNVKVVRSRENVATFEWLNAFASGTARNRRP